MVASSLETFDWGSYWSVMQTTVTLTDCTKKMHHESDLVTTRFNGNLFIYFNGHWIPSLIKQRERLSLTSMGAGSGPYIKYSGLHIHRGRRMLGKMTIYDCHPGFMHSFAIFSDSVLCGSNLTELRVCSVNMPSLEKLTKSTGYIHELPYLTQKSEGYWPFGRLINYVQ